MSRYSINRMYRDVLVLGVFVTAVAFGLSESTGPFGSNAQAVHAAGYDGQGIGVGLISQSHARVSHEAFDGHAHWYDATGAGTYEPISHDTSVGGIVCSRGGAAYPEAIGVAPGAELYSYRVTQPDSDGSRTLNYGWVQAALDRALADGCDVIVTGIQVYQTPDGESLWSLMYDYYAYRYNLFFATASGNYEPEVTVFGDAYNGVTTAGLAVNAGVYNQVGSASNSGPTADGRHKPDLSAPSQRQRVPVDGSDTAWGVVGSSAGQTSWAAPHTAGAAALLLEYAGSSMDADDGQNVVIKAVIVNATFPNILDKDGAITIDPFSAAMPWDADRGYGRLDAYRAFETLRAVRQRPGGFATSQLKGWGYESLSGGQTHSYWVAGVENERLTATVTWNRRVEWNDQLIAWQNGHGDIQPGELVGFTANLDLQVYDPDGVPLIPQPSGYAADDNLEKCDLLLAKTGTYEVRIRNQSTSESAAYGLAFEVLEPLAGDVDLDYVVDLADVSELAGFWLASGCDDPAVACFTANQDANPRIDLGDFAVLAANWLATDTRYYPYQ